MLVSGVTPAFVAVNEGTLPLPLLAPRPIASFVRDQEKVAPGTLLVNTMDGTDKPIQWVWFATVLIFGTGFTVIVNVMGVPVQTAPVVGEVTGVTVIVAAIGALVALVVINEAISPEPLAAKPMPVLLFVQLKMVPGTDPVKLISAVAEPLQST